VHPVTTELHTPHARGGRRGRGARRRRNWVIIDPNNDEGCDQIRQQLTG